MAIGLYQHYKGGRYEVQGLVRHSETLEVMVLYRALYGEHGLWVRPRSMFEQRIMVDGVMVARFERLAEGPPVHGAASSEHGAAGCDAG
ncbi:MAG: DUF1653 domain-containing protein [Betaproteobacteria bacterium]